MTILFITKISCMQPDTISIAANDALVPEAPLKFLKG